MKFLINLITFFIANPSVAQISSVRAQDLDSVVCYIPKKFTSNLDSVHAYLHKNGTTDEERVFLFYGYLSCFQYDNERYNDFKAPYFSPQFTAQRKKGVCRDFARVFEYLCKKSNLKVCVVTGKAPERLWHTVKKKLHFISNYTNHQWNIVFYNDSWHLMDPTWTGIETIEKLVFWNKKTRANERYSIKRFKRTYFDCQPEMMALQHKPIHPAFYLLDTVPTYKTALKKEKWHKEFAINYDFMKILDSIFQFEFPTLTHYFDQGCIAYASFSQINQEFNYLLEQREWKNARYFKPTLDYYDEVIEEMKRVTNYIWQNAGRDYRNEFTSFEKTMLEKREKLKKKLKNTSISRS